MAILTLREKLFVVERLACFDELDEVVRGVRDTFDKDVTKAQIWRYNAAAPAARREMSAELVGIFDKTRAEFLAETSAIPIANRAYRLRELQKLHTQAKGMGAIAIAANVLEQAAKESGGAFTNKSHVEHSGKVETGDGLTDEERADRVMALLDRARARRADGADRDGES